MSFCLGPELEAGLDILSYMSHCLFSNHICTVSLIPQKAAQQQQVNCVASRQHIYTVMENIIMVLEN